MTANKGVFEQVLDKIPYVMVGVLGIACTIILIYGIYISIKNKDKRALLTSIVYFVNIIFAGFLVFVITTVIQMDAGEHLSMEQWFNLLVAMVGIVVFNILVYNKLDKSKPVKTVYRNVYNPRIKRVDYEEENITLLEFGRKLGESGCERSFKVGQIISVRMKDKVVIGEILYIGASSLTIKDHIGTEITISYGDIWEIEDIMCGSTELFYFNPDSCYIDNWANAICRMTNDIVGIDYENFERYADEFYIKFLIAFTFEYERKLKDTIDYNSLKKMAERFDTDFMFQAKDYLEKNAPGSLAMKYYEKFMVIRVDKDYILQIINRCRIRIVEYSRVKD